MKRGRFVIHKHQATHLHYDFHLEMDGVLKSWAVPKGVPGEVGVRRLAVEVEDHPIEYIDFEGRIPEGFYGAGEVEIWDTGEYELKERKTNQLTFKLQGRKIEGVYVLIHTGADKWLILKKKSSE